MYVPYIDPPNRDHVDRHKDDDVQEEKRRVAEVDPRKQAEMLTQHD